MDAVNIVGAAASIGGLIITLLILARVKKIESSYKRQGLLPKYIERLQGLAVNLQNAVDQKDIDGLHEQLASAEQVLAAVCNVIPEDCSRSQGLAARMSQMRASMSETIFASCRTLLLDLRGEGERLTLLAEQYAWSSRDGN